MPAILVHREFNVELPIEKAWQHLSRVTEWPSWAKHIRRVEMEDDELGPQSSGTIHLRNGIKSTFSMTGFDPWRNWEWTGRFLWLNIRYDHLFESLTPQQTKLTWIVEGEGLGISILGKLFARIYNKNLDRAVPLLIEEMNASVERNSDAN